MKAVLIGGGDFGVVQDKPYNLDKIDDTIFMMTGKPHPRILFIGFNERANFVFGAFKKHYIGLGAMCEYLKHTELGNAKTVESKFGRADAIYIGGGNSIEYMKLICEFGLDKKIIDASNRGVVLAGISAGAICYSSFGMSDAGLAQTRNFTKVSGLGIVDVLFCPHYRNSEREKMLPDFLKGLNKVALCVDEQVAVVIDGDEYKIVKTNDSASAFKCCYLKDKFIKEEIESGKVDEFYFNNWQQ